MIYIHIFNVSKNLHLNVSRNNIQLLLSVVDYYLCWTQWQFYLVIILNYSAFNTDLLCNIWNIKLKSASSLPATGFLACGGGGGGICWRFVEALGEDPLCKLSQVLLRLRNVTGESPDPVPPPPAYDGGLLRDFFSGVRHPFWKRNICDCEYI